MQKQIKSHFEQINFLRSAYPTGPVRWTTNLLKNKPEKISWKYNWLFFLYFALNGNWNNLSCQAGELASPTRKTNRKDLVKN